MDADQRDALQARVREAMEAHTPLCLTGSGSKAFLGNPVRGEPLSLAGHRGILSYEPTELVVTARAGTPLAELEAVLAAEGQHLPFEPPRFGPGATLGGTVASGLCGPRRPWSGSVRDHVLGVTVLTGKGDILHFGGEVMKNVAGYDVARLMCGAFGTLGILLDISLKVLPRAEASETRVLECAADAALDTLRRLGGESLPLTGAAHVDGCLYLRLEGSEATVAETARRLGGETLDEADSFWTALREQTHPFFAGEAPLWRLSLPPAAPLPVHDEPLLLDWGGAQRWLRSFRPADAIRAGAEALGGHATAFRQRPQDVDAFHPLPMAARQLHLRLKEVFDPQGLFNYGCLYPDL